MALFMLALSHDEWQRGYIENTMVSLCTHPRSMIKVLRELKVEMVHERSKHES
jgi:hypothetical protein